MNSSGNPENNITGSSKWLRRAIVCVALLLIYGCMTTIPPSSQTTEQPALVIDTRLAEAYQAYYLSLDSEEERERLQAQVRALAPVRDGCESLYGNIDLLLVENQEITYETYVNKCLEIFYNSIQEVFHINRKNNQEILTIPNSDRYIKYFQSLDAPYEYKHTKGYTTEYHSKNLVLFFLLNDLSFAEIISGYSQYHTGAAGRQYDISNYDGHFSQSTGRFECEIPTELFVIDEELYIPTDGNFDSIFEEFERKFSGWRTDLVDHSRYSHDCLLELRNINNLSDNSDRYIGFDKGYWDYSISWTL